MIHKQRLNNRILSLVLALVMVLSMLPMTSLTAFAASASATPVIKEADRYVAAFGTPIYIEAGTTEGYTVVWYYKSGTKTYLTANGDSGQDLSGYTVYGGTPPFNDNYYSGNEWHFDWRTITATSITMTGGTLTEIVANSYRNYESSATLRITGGTVGSICFGNNGTSDGNDGTSTGLVLIDTNVGNHITIFTGIYRSDDTYIARGAAEIPSDFTLTVSAGETLSVPQGASLTNNGTIVNNGTITVDGTLTNNGTVVNSGTITVNRAPNAIGTITGNGTIIRNAAYITTDSSGTPSVWVNGSAATDFTTEYVGGKLYIYNVTGNIKATLNGTDYYGVQTSGSSTELTADYISTTGISGIPAEIVANKPVALNAVLSPELTTFATTVSYSLENAGDTGAVLNGNVLTAYKPGTVELKVTATDGYSSYSETFSITVNHIPVTGLSGEVPSAMIVGSKITLPTALPSDASYTAIEWSFVSGESDTGASITNGVLTATKGGSFTVRATIKNGTAYGTDYIEDFTVKASAVSGEIDIGHGSVTISENTDGTLRVAYSGFENGYKDYATDDMIVITGTTTTNTVTVNSGSPYVVLSDCSITISTTASPFRVASGATVNLFLNGSNVLKNTNTGSASTAGLSVPQGAEVDISGDGSLEASGGKHAAGIGGCIIDGSYKAGGTITINGGTITATGGEYGAGIGGGYHRAGGTITINGGTITANGGYGGAGIGGGYNGAGGNVTITGGTITANGGYDGAGIGGGCNGAGETVTISGGTVTANGGGGGNTYGGAGIGGGRSGAGGTITITGGEVTATGYNGAGIGGGSYGAEGTVTITGGKVTANSKSGGAGIGGGYNRAGGNVTITGGTVTTTGGASAAGIGGGAGPSGNGGTVEINGGNVKATAGSTNAEAIGKSARGTSSGTLTNGATNGGQSLTLVTITLAGVSGEVKVDSIGVPAYYGMDDVVTMDGGTLYLYLPNGERPTKITLENGDTYYGRMNDDASSATFYKIDMSEKPDVDEDGYYLIADIGDLIWFSGYVAGVDNTVSGRVTADIDASGSEFASIGVANAPYAGTFDGGYYRITVGINAAEDYAALFDYVNGATIQDLIVDGSITTSAKFASGLIGSSAGTTTVKNVISNVSITSSVSGDGTHGGFVGTASGTLVMENCGFAGAINGSSTNSCGGLIGWANNGTSITIRDSYLAAGFGVGAANGHTIARNYAKASVNITNFYYLNALNETPASDGITQKTVDQFKGGEVTYLLNKGATDGTQVWYQTLDGDGAKDYPQFSGERVYRTGDCQNTGYGNTDTGYEEHPEYNDNGFCAWCKAYQPAVLKNGVYEISNVGQMFWFAGLVNGGDKSANAILTADIDMAGHEWTPICQTDSYYTSDSAVTDAGYAGTFDGNGHVISNLTVKGRDSGSTKSYGLFGTLSGMVKRLGLDSYSFNATAPCRAGGIAGQVVSGGCITDCYVINSKVLTDRRIVGGIAGCNYGGTIQDCFVQNTEVTGSSDRCGWISGDCQDNGGKKPGTVINCYTDGTRVVSSQSGNATVTDCAVVTDEQFASGEITYKLNGDQSSIVWYQTLSGNDVKAYPQFSGDVVYAVGNCKEITGYSNDSTGYTDHPGYNNGFCTLCGGYQPAVKNGDVYEISNAGQLFWFARQVNSGDTAINGKLMKNIDLESREWTPIGTTSNPYTGIFDGQGLRIKNMTIDTTAEYQGLFGAVSGGVHIKNVIIDASCSIKAGNYSAAIVGGSTGSGSVIIENCGNEASVNAGQNASGIFGVNMKSAATVTISNCYNTGNITATSEGGGISGWVGAGGCTVTNCWSSGVVTNGDSFARGNTAVTFTNCYYLESLTVSTLSGINTFNAEQLENGALTYLLNGSTSEGSLVWYQTLTSNDAQAYPQFSGGIVYYDADADKPYYNDPAEVVSITITWTEMSFSYNKGTWNTESLTWENGGWVADEGCGTVTVENTGSVTVNTEFKVDITDTDYFSVSVGFAVNGTELTDNKMAIPAGEKKTVWVTLSGSEPTAYIEDKKSIGSITIVLSTE